MSVAADERTVVRQTAVDASAPPGGAGDGLRVTSGLMLVCLSLLVLWFLLYLLVFSGLAQGRAQSALYGQLRTELAEGTAPTGAPIPPGHPVALLSIPGAGVDNVVVVEGTRPQQLKAGPGHLAGSVLPGQQGVSVIAGRSLTFGAPFTDIARLPAGGTITVTTSQGVFAYHVAGVRRKGDPGPVPLPTDGSRLTLVTSAPQGGALAAVRPGQTVYVDAVLETGAVPAAAVGVSDGTAQLMSVKVDPGTLALLALSLQLLIVALAGLVWAWARWSPLAGWIAGGPVVLAALWLVSAQLTSLLPGLV